MINWSRAASIASAAVAAVFVWTASVAAQGSTLVITFTEPPDSANAGVDITTILNGVNVSSSCFTNPSNGSPVCRNSNEFGSVDFTVPGATLPTVTTQVRLMEPSPAPAGTVSDFLQFGASNVADHFRVSFTSLPETGGSVPTCGTPFLTCLSDITEVGRSQFVFQTLIAGTTPFTLTVNALSDIDEVTSTVPEPGTLLLVGSGMLLGLRAVRRRRPRL
jgi:hypothetical protein